MRFSRFRPTNICSLSEAGTIRLGMMAAFFLGAFLLPGLSSAANSDVIYEDSFSVSDLTWDQDAQGGLVPVLSQTRTLDQPGLPQLLAKDLLLLVPVDWQVENAWVQPLATHHEKQPGPLAIGANLPTSEGGFVTAGHMQAQDGVFPATWSEFQGTHTWHGYRLLALRVFPMRQASGQLEFLDSYEVQVQYRALAGSDDMVTRERFVPGEKEADHAVLAKVVANAENLSTYLRQEGMVVAKLDGGFNPDKSPSLSGSAVDYLIITNEEMAPAFQVLADHKTAQGMNALVATREYITANFRNGADIQETMRMFIKDAYQKWGTQYVLLGGDTDILPARIVSNTFYPASGHTDIPVDLYFACLDGNWNANGNAFYGEPAHYPDDGDDVDFAEEIYLGRATVSNPAAAEVFVSKTMSYANVEAGAQWPGRVLYASEVLFPSEYEEGVSIILDGAQFSDQMVNDLVEPCTDMERVRMYETDALFEREAPLGRSALIDSLNTGHYGIFNQIGHGYYYNMSVGDGNFMTMDADELVNGDNFFMLFSLNCASCAFDQSCLMERFLQNPNGGSVISIGSARAAFPNTSNNYQQEFFSHLYCDSEIRVGRLVALSRLPFIGSTHLNYVDRWTFENYTLLGDPSLMIWTGVPQGTSVDVSEIALGPNTVTVQVTDGVSPVAGAEVCLSRAGEDHSSGVTGADGRVYLDYLATAEGEISLTVSGKNIAHSTEMIPVQDGNSYLAVLGMNIRDDNGAGSAGNGNQMAEAGETVALLSVLNETAGNGAVGLSGTLSSDDSRVNILNDSVTYPNVAGGGQTVSQGYFVVEIRDDVPDGTNIVFDLAVTDGAANTYVSQWSTIVKAPEVEVVVLEWEDTTYGNGDGTLDPFERVNVLVDIKNFGAGTADAIDAVLRTTNPNVTLFDTLATFPATALMEQTVANRVFSLQLNDTSRKSESTLVLEDNYGRITTHDFFLQKPLAPELIETDTSLGSDVIALRWSPSSSTDVLGYNVYRSTQEFGPFVQVNTDLVEGVSYFRDEGLERLTRYYYKVSSVYDSMVSSEQSLTAQGATAPAEQTGFPVDFVDETSGHSAVGDIDGDGDLEIILASDEIYVWHHDGSELLDGDSSSQTLGPFTNLDSVLQPSGVTLAQLDGDSGLEIIVSERENGDRIHVFRKDGTELPGWPQSLSGPQGTDWNWATPAVGDVDGDGDPEIVVNTVNGVTWVWHHDGTELRDGDNNPATNGFFYFRSGAQWEWTHASPALYDLDGDGARDIIFGCKVAAEGQHRLMAIKYDGSDVAGFPYIASGGIDVSPAVADLNNDGVMEIVFYDNAQNLHVVQDDGSSYPGYPVDFQVGATTDISPSPALGDMDGDGQLEIILAVNVSGDEARLMVFDTDVSGGTSGDLLNGWPLEVPGSSEGSPVVGDIDGDESPDILFGIGGGSEDAPNNLYAFHASGQPVDGFPITVNGPYRPSPVICDLDHDFDVDIVYGGWDRQVHVWDMPFAYDRRNVPWPTFSGNVQRDGVFFPIELVPVEEEPEQLPSALKVGAPYPNPFNPSTTVRLYVPASGQLDLAVYDLQGRKVRTLHQGAIATGWHTMVWDGRDDSGQGQASGMYFMRASSAEVTNIQKMTLVK